MCTDWKWSLKPNTQHTLFFDIQGFCFVWRNNEETKKNLVKIPAMTRLTINECFIQRGRICIRHCVSSFSSHFSEMASEVRRDNRAVAPTNENKYPFLAVLFMCVTSRGLGVASPIRFVVALVTMAANNASQITVVPVKICPETPAASQSRLPIFFSSRLVRAG